MSGEDFSGRLDRVGFWAGVWFVFSFLCRFSFLSCCLFSFAGSRLLSELDLHGTDIGFWEYEMTVKTRRRMGEQETRVLRTRWLGRSCAGKTAPTTTKPRIGVGT